jgi:hypothetical protein
MRARDPDEIRAAMQARGNLSQRELGRLALTTYGTVGNILAGEVTSREIAKRIARSLLRPVDVLFVPASSSSKQAIDHSAATAGRVA